MRLYVGVLGYTGHMFEQTATEYPAGLLAAVTEPLAKLPYQLWRTSNDGFAEIAAAMDALAVGAHSCGQLLEQHDFGLLILRDVRVAIDS